MAAALGVGVGVVGGAGDPPGAGDAVEGRVVGGAALDGAEVLGAEELLGAAEGDEVAVGGGGGAAAAGGAEAEGDGGVEGRVALVLVAVGGDGVGIVSTGSLAGRGTRALSRWRWAKSDKRRSVVRSASEHTVGFRACQMSACVFCVFITIIFFYVRVFRLTLEMMLCEIATGIRTQSAIDSSMGT